MYETLILRLALCIKQMKSQRRKKKILKDSFNVVVLRFHLQSRLAMIFIRPILSWLDTTPMQ